VTTTRARRPLLRTLLDGERTWGSLQVSEGRYGMSRYHLVVFPPGLRREERIPLRLWRSYPIWGLALWLTLHVAVMTATSPGYAFAVSTGTCLALGAVVLAMSGPARGAVRTLTVVRMVGVHDDEILVRHHEFQALAERLIRADALFEAGALTAAQHEAAVWYVYDQIGR
jgi:hypothetical protein